MTFIPIEILTLIFGVSFALPLLGYIYRTQLPMSIMFFIVGASWLVIFLTTDDIALEFATAFDGIESLIVYNVPSRTGQDDVRANNSAIYAEFVSSSSSQLVGDTVNCLTLHIKKSGAPDLNTIVRYGVWDNSAIPILKYTFGTMNVTAVPTTVQPIKHCNMSEQYTIVNGDRIGIAWNDGDAVNRITMDLDTTNPFDGTTTFIARFNGATWVSATETDYQGQMSLETDGDGLLSEPVLYAIRDANTLEPTFVGMIFIIFSISMIVIGALIEVKWSS